jgi:hypothetical protein
MLSFHGKVAINLHFDFLYQYQILQTLF